MPTFNSSISTLAIWLRLPTTFDDYFFEKKKFFFFIKDKKKRKEVCSPEGLVRAGSLPLPDSHFEKFHSSNRSLHLSCSFASQSTLSSHFFALLPVFLIHHHREVVLLAKIPWRFGILLYFNSSIAFKTKDPEPCLRFLLLHLFDPACLYYYTLGLRPRSSSSRYTHIHTTQSHHEHCKTLDPSELVTTPARFPLKTPECRLKDVQYTKERRRRTRDPGHLEIDNIFANF